MRTAKKVFVNEWLYSQISAKPSKIPRNGTMHVFKDNGSYQTSSSFLSRSPNSMYCYLHSYGHRRKATMPRKSPHLQAHIGADTEWQPLHFPGSNPIPALGAQAILLRIYKRKVNWIIFKLINHRLFRQLTCWLLSFFKKITDMMPLYMDIIPLAPKHFSPSNPGSKSRFAHAQFLPPRMPHTLSNGNTCSPVALQNKRTCYIPCKVSKGLWIQVPGWKVGKLSSCLLWQARSSQGPTGGHSQKKWPFAFATPAETLTGTR